MKNILHTAASSFPRALAYPTALFIAAAALTGCLFGNSSEGGEGAKGEETQSSVYTVSGNRIITPASSDTETYCEGDSLTTEVYRDSADTVVFSIVGNVLTVVAGQDTTETGAIVEWMQVFTRTGGSGSGLEGSWTITNQQYRVASGNLSADEKAGYDADVAHYLYSLEVQKFTVQFAGGKITTFVDRQNAKAFIRNWNEGYEDLEKADSAKYDISLKEVDKNTVELKGLKSGETVRITRTFEVITYSSDIAAHTVHTYYQTPKSCPNAYEPEWYRQFLTANRKIPVVLEKSGEISAKKQISHQFPFVPLKTMHSLLN